MQKMLLQNMFFLCPVSDKYPRLQQIRDLLEERIVELDKYLEELPTVKKYTDPKLAVYSDQLIQMLDVVLGEIASQLSMAADTSNYQQNDDQRKAEEDDCISRMLGILEGFECAFDYMSLNWIAQHEYYESRRIETELTAHFWSRVNIREQAINIKIFGTIKKPEQPSTMRGVMGAISPSAYD